MLLVIPIQTTLNAGEQLASYIILDLTVSWYQETVWAGVPSWKFCK